MTQSPFKFLDSYTKDDRDIFFGRDREIEELYQKVFESKILLLYGVSGTGKSSLIDCGLGNKIADSDWLPVNVRRGSGMVESLVAQLSSFEGRGGEGERGSELATRTSEHYGPKQIVKLINSVYLDHFKPVYLIFDQLEELFIFGSREEQQEFVAILKAIVEADVQCKILISLRAEYLADITRFEGILPDIIENRMRIEKMSRANAIEVISGPCKVSGIELEEGFETALLSKLVPEGDEIELTYLQVYLDKVFKLSTLNSQLSTESISFRLSHLDQLGNVGDLLGSFLEDQIAELDDPESGLAILKSFVSVKGTKRQITHDEVLESCRSLGRDVKSAALKELISKFVDLRILREKDDAGRYELRHDSLASKIYEKITLVEKEMLEIRQFLETALNNHNKRGVFLSIEDLKYIAPFEDRLFMNKATEKFIEDSKSHVARARKRIRRLTSAAAIVLILVMGGFTTWALKERKLSQENEIRFKSSFYNAKAKEIVESDPTMALRLAEYALSVHEDQEIRQTINKIYTENSFYRIVAHHDALIMSIAFSPDGSMVLTGSQDNRACLWDLQGNLVQEFIGHSGGINAVAFSPHGKYILTGALDGTIRLWKLDGTVVKNYNVKDVVEAVAFSPNGRNILAGLRGGSCRLINIDTDNVESIEGNNAEVGSVDFSPNGNIIIVGLWDDNIQMYNINGEHIRTIIGHTRPVISVKFSPKGDYILSSSYDETARLWDLKGNLIHTFDKHNDIVTSAVFSPSGKNILTGSFDDRACLWDLDGNILQTFIGNREYCRSVAFAPDGKSIITTDSDFVVKLWEVTNNRIQINTGNDDDIGPIAFSLDGGKIFIGLYNGLSVLYDNEGNELTKFSEYFGPVLSAEFSPNGKEILTGHEDGRAILWDINGNVLRIYNGHSGPIHNVSFSSDGRKILTGSDDKGTYSSDGIIKKSGHGGEIIRLWNKLDEDFFRYEWHSDYLSYVTFLADSSKILSASYDGIIRIWDLEGNLTKEYKLDDQFGKVDYSPNSDYILTSSFSDKIKLWDTNGNLIQSYSGMGYPIRFISFMRDGSGIIICPEDKTLRIYDLEGNLVQNYYLTSGITKMISSLDGKKILTLGWGNKLLIWDVKRSYKEFNELNNYESMSITFKLEQGIFDYSSINKSWNQVDLFEAAQYYYNLRNEDSNTDDENGYLERSIMIYEQLVKVIEDRELINIEYITGLMDIYIQLYIMEIDKEEIISQLLKLNSLLRSKAKSDLLGVLTYYDDKCSSLDSLDFILEFPEGIAEIGSKLISEDPENEFVCDVVSRACSNLSYSLIENNKYPEALEMVELSLLADSTYKYSYTNLPLAYILNDQYDNAIDVYEKWKDKQWSRQETFREVFLEDIDYLENQGITHPDFAKIRALLEEETIEPAITE